jgi:DNA-binding response OmpR family regulator
MKPHILTIDDESIIRELLHEILSASGYRVTGVSTLDEAMRIVKSDPPNLIITDLQLEESDGFDVVVQVKAVLPAVPIILLTGVLFDRQVMRGPVGERIAAYIEKTAPLERVLAEVRKHLPPAGAAK